ncbi:uncharacterized protein LOC129806219 [Phlebotomus papatasi]|uniref:uncharacterized protein LOC129806219 n=1 Tax=Phlebotomus papatasi TaxID=29031 RepID=UPI002483990C|nr:uncharacterized protein LOC129806219 [Phlebotomus papatasi]
MKVLLAFLTFSLAVSSVFSLRCYFCVGTNGTSCAYPPNLPQLQQNSCNNVCTTLVYHSGNSTTTTIRGCNPNNFCRNPPMPSHQIISCNTCNRNLCNNSNILKGNILSVLFIGITLFFTKVYLF